jgi:hypothetical protein
VTAGAEPGVLLAFTHRLRQPVEIDEALNVYEDGGVWYWSLKPAEVTRDRVGTFGFSLDGEDLGALEELADEALEETQGEVEPERNAVEVVLRARRGDREGAFLLSAAGGVSEPLARLRAIGDDLLRRAGAAPLAVVRLTWRTLETALEAAKPATLLFGFENIGVQPVDILMRQDAGFTVYAQAGDVWEPWWSSGASGTPGLVGTDASLLGGILTPAKLAPGATAQAVFAESLTPPAPGSRPLGARVEGGLSLLRPVGADEFPQAEFRLETDPQEVEIT